MIKLSPTILTHINNIWQELVCTCVSFSQKRKRVFIFAYKKNTKYATNINSGKEGLFSKTFPVNENVLKTNNFVKVTPNYSSFGQLIMGVLIGCLLWFYFSLFMLFIAEKKHKIKSVEKSAIYFLVCLVILIFSSVNWYIVINLILFFTIIFLSILVPIRLRISILNRSIKDFLLDVIPLCIFIIISMIIYNFCAERIEKIPSYDKIAVMGSEIAKEDISTYKLSETDVENVNKYIFKHIEELKDYVKTFPTSRALTLGIIIDRLVMPFILICAVIVFIGSIILWILYNKKSFVFGVILCWVISGLVCLNLYYPNAFRHEINATSNYFYGPQIVNEIYIDKTGPLWINNLSGSKHNATGQGYWKGTNGTAYIGEFTAGSITGYGTMTDKDGNEFIGDFLFGNIYGDIKVVSANGDILYEGEILGKPATMETISECLSLTP